MGFVHLLRMGRPPPALLADGREDDFHLRELSVEILQVLLDPCDELYVPKVISSTVDHQDIWHSSSSKAPMKEGEEVSPNHAPLLEPLDLGIQTMVGPDGLPHLFFPASLRVLPNKSQFFQYESFSLSCGEPGKSSHWRVIKNTSTLINKECPLSWNRRNESHCFIDDLYPSDTGVYWCESGTGECSNTINITVAAGPVILESPVLPVMEGDDVTLSCKNRNTMTFSSNLTTNFYKNGCLMATSSTGNITIHSISKSDEGFYKCNISGVGQSTDSWLAVRGQSEVIGSTQPIIASPGDDVILPCHLDPEFNVKGLTVEWSKLKPDPSDRLSRDAYVHLYRHRQEDLDMKIPAYLNRTELFTDELERGNISLKIMNVTLADEGRYRCLVPKLKSRVKFAIVELVVESKSDETWTTETPLHPQTPDPTDETDVKGGCYSRSALISAVMVCCILLIFGGLVGGYLFKQRRQKPNHPKYAIV
ncbi:uncharacterized protein [Thunnus thynnus]|uniref:uncharacterized protein isoform X2 n=1 Tax=Thunnus thynnus TaxID=8237 RepID=UPI003528C156